jgi:class 3 adenylate cyclase/pimeloyl-ACP methyl ester carboxylesterase
VPQDPGSTTGERRLAAILFTDIVGSTAVTARSESAGLALRDRHRELVRTQVERYHGRFIEAPGDESLSTFESAVDAVHAALAIHDEVEREAEFGVHIGVHLGETVFRGEEVFGDGVNIAARLLSLSPGGGICVSDEVYQTIRNQPDLEAVSLGTHDLKNVGRPVTVFEIGRPGTLADVPQPGRSLWKRVLMGSAAALVLLLAGAYLFQRPLLRLYVPYVMKGIEPEYEQQIQMTTTSDDVTIAYAVVGEGPTLVVVPGWFTHIRDGLNSPKFDPLTPALSDRYQIVRYDVRGAGLSQRGVPDLSLEGGLKDLEAVVDVVGVDRVALFAVSAGGPTAISYAARHSERVSGLVLAGTYARLGRDPDIRAQWEAFGAVVKTGWGTDHSAIRKMFTLLLVPEADEVLMQAMNEFQRIGANPEDAAFFVAEQGRIDVRDLARQIRAPTLVMHVEGDQQVPFEVGQELAGLIPGARFVPLPGVNHLVQPGDAAADLQQETLEEWLATELAVSPTPGPPLTSIAVLPFDDLSPSGDQRWPAGGMAEEP